MLIFCRSQKRHNLSWTPTRDNLKLLSTLSKNGIRMKVGKIPRNQNPKQMGLMLVGSGVAHVRYQNHFSVPLSKISYLSIRAQVRNAIPSRQYMTHILRPKNTSKPLPSKHRPENLLPTPTVPQLPKQNPPPPSHPQKSGSEIPHTTHTLPLISLSRWFRF
jgi:hypothetical protein